MSEAFDVSVPLSPLLPVWPGSSGYAATPSLQIASGDLANASDIAMDVHVGTHVDAPRHFIADGADLESVGLDPFLGRAFVAEFTRDADGIAATDLESLGLPDHAERLLVKANSPRWFEEPFDENYTALTADAAEWVVDRGLRLVGIDYLSIQRFSDGPEAHQTLLGRGVVILEGLNLGDVAPGEYDLTCLPLRLQEAEAAPARAILRRID